MRWSFRNAAVLGFVAAGLIFCAAAAAAPDSYNNFGFLLVMVVVAPALACLAALAVNALLGRNEH